MQIFLLGAILYIGSFENERIVINEREIYSSLIRG